MVISWTDYLNSEEHRANMKEFAKFLKPMYSWLSEQDLDNLEWAKDFLDSYERKHGRGS